MLIEICVYEIEAPGQYQHFGNVLRHSLFTSMDKEEKGASVANSILGARSVKSLHRKEEATRSTPTRHNIRLQAPAAATEDLSTANTT
jgi:hypothetical protein